MTPALTALREGTAFLAPSPDARADARLFLQSLLGDASLLTAELDEEELRRFRDLLRRRREGCPTQYLLGEAWFMGQRFVVDERVLIPRQDSETLAEAALRIAKERHYRLALDLCTGSGCLAVTLARLGSLSVTATDISEAALAVAKQNADGLPIRFLQGDLWEALPRGERFDLIVCNPPYLSGSDMEALQAEVRREPALALFGGEDGLAFYRRLAAQWRDHIRPGGALLLELGIGQAEAVSALFGGGTFLRDLCDVDRVLFVDNIK